MTNPFSKVNKVVLTIAAFLFITNSVWASGQNRTIVRDIQTWNEAEEQSILVAIKSAKIKKTRADLNIVVKNKYPFSVIIPENSFHFFNNSEQGINIGNSNPRWVLKSGDLVNVTLKYKLESHETGSYTLKLEYIYQETAANEKSSTRNADEGKKLPPVVLKVADKS